MKLADTIFFFVSLVATNLIASVAGDVQEYKDDDAIMHLDNQKQQQQWEVGIKDKSAQVAESVVESSSEDVVPEAAKPVVKKQPKIHRRAVAEQEEQNEDAAQEVANKNVKNRPKIRRRAVSEQKEQKQQEPKQDEKNNEIAQKKKREEEEYEARLKSAREAFKDRAGRSVRHREL